MKNMIRKAAEDHANKGGGRSAYSFICGAEYVVDQMTELMKNSVGQHLLREYVNKMKEAINKVD